MPGNTLERISLMKPQRASATLVSAPGTSAPSLFIPGTIVAAGCLVIFASCLSRFLVPHLGSDQNSYLFEAQRFLSGAEPYGPQLAETNPPMIIWFSAIPVLLAHLLHVSVGMTFKVLLAVMICASVVWCTRLLRRSAAITNPVAIALFGCATLAAEFNMQPIDFGQREHLLIILLLPYFIAVATGAISRLSVAERCALGVTAGLAIWFKPQDTLILLGLELFLALRTRSLRRILTPEFLSLALTSSLILVLVRVLTPLYIKGIYPLLLDTYWALGTASTLKLASSLTIYTLLVLATLLVCLLLRRSLRDPATCIALLIGSFAASFAYDIQHTKWKYHAYPHRALLLLAILYLTINLLYPVIVRITSNAALVRRILLVASTASALMLCAIAIHPRFAHFAHESPDGGPLDTFIGQIPPSTTVYIFSTGVRPSSLAYMHNLVWGSRFVHLWMMPAIIQNELGPTGPPAPFKRLPPERVSQLATLQRAETTEDMNYWHPSIVLVQRCTVADDPCQGIEKKNFDMISWFQQSPDFAATWSHYRRQPSIKSYDVYKLAP
jgi:hypothetical protein